MICKTKILFCFYYVWFFFSFQSISAQKTTINSNSEQLKELKNKKLQSSKDSLILAQLYLYQFIDLHKEKKTINNLSSIDNGILACPKSQKGDSLKAVFYNKKAYLESELGFSMKSYKSILTSLKLLEKIDNPNSGYVMGAYLLLSNKNAYFGNFEQAKHYMRLAEKTYAKNKTFIDQNTWQLNGNNHRLGVIAKYRKIYMLWKLSKNSNDSLSIINTMNSLEKMHNQSNFHKEERIYYSTALNHIGDWYITHKHDSLTTFKDISTGLNFLFKAQNLTEKEKYPGTIWSIKYNIAKGFTKGNLLNKADSTMAVLFKGISKNDGRLPFFYAQKGLIKARKNQKDSALFYFNNSIKKIHRGKNILTKDYKNFKPSKSYNHTRLLLRISEELTNYYSKDSIVQKKIASIYYLALQQFENSYLDTNFNAKQNNQLRRIIQGVLRNRKTGYLNNYLPQKTILNKFEIFRNKLEWKKFYENRYTNILPELDSIKNRNLELASLINKAKIAKNVPLKDSIQKLIYTHEDYKKKEFPQLELLSNFNFSIDKLQEKLTNKDLILKYILLNNEIAIYQISKNNFKVQILPWRANEKNELNNFIKNIRNRNYNSNLGMKLGQKLIPDVNESITHLIINPDGMLFKLPFETLQTKGKFTTDRFQFSYTSNLGLINFKSNKTSTSKDILIYAPLYANTSTNNNIRNKPSFLKGASTEAKNISKLFPSKLYNDKNLTKAKFISTAVKGKILHLAMHAEVNYDYPELSRLLFSNNLKNEDEHLYLEELYGLSLNAELAILSACNTGSGIEKNGNLESFQRAFTFAGVPATVVSLWEVPDSSTEQIMVLFYKNLKEGQTKSEALQNAKLRFREANTFNKLSAPYFWAGFVVYGDDAPITNDKSSSFYFIITILILFVLMILYKKIIKF